MNNCTYPAELARLKQEWFFEIGLIDAECAVAQIDQHLTGGAYC